ncbi:N-acetyltransferase [Myxococcaceae bacterium GXIMD 01537]
MHLALATDAQKAQRDLLTYSAWGQTLTPEGYALREQRLRAHPWSVAEMKTWLLLGDGGEVLASCETFRTDSFLRAPDGGLSPGDSYGVASVFTEERLRGRGHATRLMDLVAAELERGSPRAHAALLYSDVGAAIYARSGYRALLAWDWHLPPGEGAPGEGVDALLGEADVPAALARMRRPEAPFYLWPHAAQVDWHVERERIYAQALGRPRPEAQGATVGDSTALWAMTAKDGELKVLLLDARSAGDARALASTARRVARRAGLSRVVIWEEPATAGWLAGLPGAARVAREGALPMVRSLRPGLPEVAPPVPRVLWL